MNLHKNDAEDGTTALRRAWCAPIEGDPADCGGPASERIWAARHGELTVEERREIVDHVALCASCAESWRLAGELGERVESGLEAVERAPARVAALHRHGWGAGLRWVAAAAVLVLGLGYSFQQWHRQPKILVRGDAGSVVEPLVEEGRTLPRARFVLRWSEVEGANYKIEVTDENLDLIDSAEGLAVAHYQVPEPKLAAQPAGASLLWQVEVRHADGHAESSETFLVKVE